MNKTKLLFTSWLLLLFATYSCENEGFQPETNQFSEEVVKNVNSVFLNTIIVLIKLNLFGNLILFLRI